LCNGKNSARYLFEMEGNFRPVGKNDPAVDCLLRKKRLGINRVLGCKIKMGDWMAPIAHLGFDFRAFQGLIESDQRSNDLL
jgi:hypothetical protein